MQTPSMMLTVLGSARNSEEDTTGEGTELTQEASKINSIEPSDKKINILKKGLKEEQKNYFET